MASMSRSGMEAMSFSPPFSFQLLSLSFLLLIPFPFSHIKERATGMCRPVGLDITGARTRSAIPGCRTLVATALLIGVSLSAAEVPFEPQTRACLVTPRAAQRRWSLAPFPQDSFGVACEFMVWA